MGGGDNSKIRFTFIRIFIKKGSVLGMEENVKQLLQEYRSTKESLESGLKWLPKNEYAKSKIEVINMVIKDLEQLEKTFA
ncbi:hypothetical protein CLSAP_28270 [Clostridium saccharoperbutylacetonicum]|nr:hypothetical protein CLSAP_28270 [Clostridium saccharoperbutylacetonicum]